MADIEIRAQDKTAGVQWGQFIIALIVLVLGAYSLVSAKDAKVERLETRVNDSDLPKLPMKLQGLEIKVDGVNEKVGRLESKVDELLRRKH